MLREPLQSQINALMKYLIYFALLMLSVVGIGAAAPWEIDQPAQASLPGGSQSPEDLRRCFQEIVIDEKGNAEWAKAVDGHPLLRAASLNAACRARYSPSQVSGQPRKSQNVVPYTFVND